MEIDFVLIKKITVFLYRMSIKQSKYISKTKCEQKKRQCNI